LKITRSVQLGIFSGLLLMAAVGCGGGGGGGNNSTSNIVADFAASCTNGSPCATNSVNSEKGSAAGNVVQVQIWLNKLSTTIGEASVDITYDSTVAKYQGYTEGNALGTSSGGSVYLVNEVAPGEVLADISPLGGMTPTSPNVMITLTFRLLKASTGSNFTFKNPDTLAGSALYRTDGSIIILGASAWTGGLIIGN
jgi:hypothetical protein